MIHTNPKPSPTPDLGALQPIVEALADAVAARLGDRDELVPIAAKELGEMGLEHAAVLRLVEEGRLRAVAIGRRRFTTRRRLLALLDELPPTVRADAAEPHSDLHDAVAKARARRQRKLGQVREIASAAPRAA